MSLTSIFLWLSGLHLTAAALNPSCHPGGSFDLTKWALEMPIGQPNNPKVVQGPQLATCQGFQDSKYFYTAPDDGAVVMMVPGSPQATGCVKWKESDHCRTEFAQTNPFPWNPKASVNRLTARLSVTAAGGRTCIGQVFMDVSAQPKRKPACELYYDDDGRVWTRTREGGNQKPYELGKIPLGTTFNYEIRYENNKLMFRLNENAFIEADTAGLNAPLSFFKVGNYLQGDKQSIVRFYSINANHGQAETPGECDKTSPPIIDNVVNIRQYPDANCCNGLNTTKMSTLDSCNDASQPLGSFRQAVGQSMFGRNIRILAYKENGCQGAADSFYLTNQLRCWNATQEDSRWKSFKITAKGAS